MDLDTQAASETTPTPDTGTQPESGTTTTTETAPLPGSPEGLNERFSKAENPEPKAAPASAAAPAKPEAQAPAPQIDLSAHLEALAKEGKPYKFTADGKEHEVKSAAHHKQLLAQGIKYGSVSREHAELKQRVQKEYGPWDAKFDETNPAYDPDFAQVNTWMFHDSRIPEFVHRVLTGKATEAEIKAISEGRNLVDQNLIRANIAERQVKETHDAQAQAQALEAGTKLIYEHLTEIQNTYGFKFWDESGQPTENGEKLFGELKAMVDAGEAKTLIAAFKLHDAYAQSLIAKKEADAAAKAKADAERRTKKQTAIREAEGASGGTAKPSPTAEKGSPANLEARFRAAIAAAR